MRDYVYDAVGVCVTSLVIGFLGAGIGGCNVTNNLQDQAIKAGVGEYYLEGKDVKFRFKTNTPPQFLPSAHWSIVTNRWNDAVTNAYQFTRTNLNTMEINPNANRKLLVIEDGVTNEFKLPSYK
jgi:hypothetical protein